MKKFSLFVTILLFSGPILAQQIPIGGWQEHLSYKNALSVTEGNGSVYCATTSGVFIFRKSDNSMGRLSKVNGLSDIEAVVLNFNPYNGKVLIAYKNSNLDLIESNAIINIPDIKRKAIIGNKAINNITFVNQYAYLSCGFGIVVLDTDRNEVKDTYYIGPMGGAINVRDITSDGIYLYAATDVGVYRALLSNPNLANYTSWTLMSGLPAGIYNRIASFFGKIYTNFSKFEMTSIGLQDSLFVYDGISWTHFIPPGFSPAGSGYTLYSLKSSNSQLVIIVDYMVLTLNSSLTGSGFYSGYFSDITRAKDAVLDNTGSIWIADSKYGLVSWRPSTGYNYRYPTGPGSENVLNMSLEDDALWVAPGGYTKYLIDGIYSYKNELWSNTNGNYPAVVNLDTLYDVVNVLVDPDNSKRVYVATWGSGLIELYNGVPVKHYTEANSTLQQYTAAGSKALFIYGMALDESKNLWVTNSGVNKSISYKTPGGGWGSLDFYPIIGTLNLEQLLVDKSDQKWAVVSNGGGGILVYKGETTAAPVLNVNARKLSTSPGNGGLPSNTVYCLAKDQDDEIWVGTDKGIAVFYSPENVFSGQDFDAQQILIEQDGHVQILLETENVLAIAVDDANRKWIGTSKSGVFLMSADGTKQIAHFDESNSPLFSNNVKSIAINRKTGEVYFGTSKGIISYRGTSTEAFEDFTDVYAFPNPVVHDYEGPIAIKGLMNNSTLKITDISGTLVYETKSEGGQAIWYGKNFKDERVSTGVYMVFCTSEDGARKMVTKILVVN